MDIGFTFLLGVLLRLGIPIAITAIVVILLHRLDRRWQKKALAHPVAPAGKPCWEIKGCPESRKKDCPAYARQDTPCWQVFRRRDGVMKETCLDCDVFRQAPVLLRN